MQFITLAAVAIAIGQAYVAVTNADMLEGRQLSQCIAQPCLGPDDCLKSAINGEPCPTNFVCNNLVLGTGECGPPV